MQPRDYMLEIIQKEIGATEFAAYRHGEDDECTIIECVMMGDILDYLDEEIYPTTYTDHNGDVCPDIKGEKSLQVISMWKYKRKNLFRQDDDCIRYIYSLLPTEVRE